MYTLAAIMCMCSYNKPVGHFEDVVSESILFCPPREQWQGLDVEPPHEQQHHKPCQQQIQQASALMIIADPHGL